MPLVVYIAASTVLNPCLGPIRRAASRIASACLPVTFDCSSDGGTVCAQYWDFS
ncbi:MAG: hypothetical protein ACRDRN_24610 [Sciscionella sp.]